ncbi:MAG: hypothetical protein ACPGTP_07250 [Bacteroidia bacterium]
MYKNRFYIIRIIGSQDWLYRFYILAFCLASFVPYIQGQNSSGEGNVYVHPKGEFAIHAEYDFSLLGQIETSRGTDGSDSNGYVSFASSGSWEGATDAAHVDGYVKNYGSSAFVFPLGDDGAYRPMVVDGSANANASYFASAPSSGVLPSGTYPSTSFGSGLDSISGVEYWDVNGANATRITLTWNTASGVKDLTDSVLTNLVIVGWNSISNEWEEIASTIGLQLSSTGSTPAYSGTSTLSTGSITTDDAIIPDSYEVYTLGAKDGLFCLNPKAYLQGALLLSATSTMTDDLRSAGEIPLSEPYSALSSFTHVGNGGGETTSAPVISVTGSDAIVDWVFIELRDTNDNTVVQETASALIQRDGDIVSAEDGASPVCFVNPVSDSVYVSVRHRNHIGVMAADPVQLTPSGKSLDFSSVSLYGSAFSTITVNGVSALWVGNTNLDDRVKYSGSVNDFAAIEDTIVNHPSNFFKATTYTFNGYELYDLNMDGEIKSSGSNNDAAILRDNILNSPCGNFFNSTTFSIIEQLP